MAIHTPGWKTSEGRFAWLAATYLILGGTLPKALQPTPEKAYALAGVAAAAHVGRGIYKGGAAKNGGAK